MRSFRITICDATRCERIDGVASFVGEDASGQFGVMAGRRPFATVLVYGLARFRRGDAPWRYVALPEATLHFADDILSLATRRYLVGDDYGRPTDGPLGVIFPHGLPETTAGNLREIFHYQVPASIPDTQLVPVREQHDRREFLSGRCHF